MDINSKYEEFIRLLIKYWNKVESVDITQVDKLMDGLSKAYLDSIAEQRETIRKHFGLLHTCFYLLEYANRVAARITAGDDPHLLLPGLTAVSIEDTRSDYRDTLVCLGRLWLASESADFNPKPYFDEVAEISNTEVQYGGSSTRDLMRNFQKTAHYRAIKAEAWDPPPSS